MHHDHVPAGRSGATVDQRVPGEPPAQVRSELLWRLAVLLYREHARSRGGDRCRCCRQPWPCSARRLAELGLRQAGSRD